MPRLCLFWIILRQIRLTSLYNSGNERLSQHYGTDTPLWWLRINDKQLLVRDYIKTIDEKLSQMKIVNLHFSFWPKMFWGSIKE